MLPLAWVSDRPSVAMIMKGRVTSAPPGGRDALTRTTEVASCPAGTSRTAGAKVKRTTFSGSSPRRETRIGWVPLRLSTVAASRPSLRFGRRSTLGSRRTLSSSIAAREDSCTSEPEVSTVAWPSLAVTVSCRVHCWPGGGRQESSRRLDDLHLPGGDVHHGRGKGEADGSLGVAAPQGDPDARPSPPVVDHDLHGGSCRRPAPLRCWAPAAGPGSSSATRSRLARRWPWRWRCVARRWRSGSRCGSPRCRPPVAARRTGLRCGPCLPAVRAAPVLTR